MGIKYKLPKDPNISSYAPHGGIHATASEFEAAAWEVIVDRPEVVVRVFILVMKARSMGGATHSMVNDLLRCEGTMKVSNWDGANVYDDWMDVLDSAFRYMYTNDILPEEDIPF